MTDLRQMLQLNKSYARSFVSIDEQLQSGLLSQSVGLELLACTSLACSLSTVLQLLIVSVPITVFCEVTACNVVLSVMLLVVIVIRL